MSASKSRELIKVMREHPLATQQGLGLLVVGLVHMGAMCPKCGYGTRVTSKRWSKCKKCGNRVERKQLPKDERSKP